MHATIVGVVPSLRQQFFRGAEPAVYVPLQTEPPTAGVLVVRTSGDPATLAEPIREEMRRLDPNLPLHGVMPLAEFMTQSRWQHRVFSTIFLVFASIAVALSAAGLFAVVSHAVSERTKEIGVRMAFGASRVGILSLFLRRAGTLLAVGAVLGLMGAVGIGSLLESTLVDTSPLDPSSMVGITLLLMVVSLSASFLPTRSAMQLDPSEVLRND